MTSRKEDDKTLKKNKKIVDELSKRPENRYCADCGAKCMSASLRIELMVPSWALH